MGISDRGLVDGNYGNASTGKSVHSASCNDRSRRRRRSRSTRNVDEDNETRQHAAERSVDLAQAIAITQESAIWFLVGNGGNGLWRLLLGVI